VAFRILKSYKLDDFRQMTPTEEFIIFTISHAFVVWRHWLLYSRLMGLKKRLITRNLARYRG